jgi:hypothetical protein
LSETISPETKNNTIPITIEYVSAKTHDKLSRQIHQNNEEYLDGYEEAKSQVAR